MDKCPYCYADNPKFTLFCNRTNIWSISDFADSQVTLGPKIEEEYSEVLECARCGREIADFQVKSPNSP